MKIREILQSEIWSKKTTRKILVILGIIVSVLVVTGFSAYEIEHRWLTPGERKAAKVALAQIDELQDFAKFTNQDFDSKAKQAEAAVEASKRAAITERDDYVALQLDLYLSFTQSDQEDIRSAEIVWKKRLPTYDSETVFGKNLNLSGTEMRTWSRWELHQELDK